MEQSNNMDVWNKYLDKINDDQKDIIKSILDMAMRLAPDAIAELPYGVPGLKLNGKPLIAVATHKQHYGIYPFSPQVIKLAQTQIGNHETSEGTIRFKYDTYPSEELIKTLIELRCKEIG